MFKTKPKEVKPTLDELLTTWTNDELLQNVSKFFSRITLSTEFIQNEEGWVVGECIILKAGDRMLRSAVQNIDWPLQPIPVPEVMLEEGLQ